MSVPPTPFRFAVTGLVACAWIAFASPGDARAARDHNGCSAENQKPCPALWKGPVCDANLGAIDGLCRRCGGEGERACPAATKGPQCRDRRKQIDGRCYAACGGLDQRACPKIMAGFPCRGRTEPNRQGFCKACGGSGEPACRALKPGEQCGANLSKDRANVCRPCGGPNQPSCPVQKSGSVCQPGFGKFDNVCRPCGKHGQRACPALEVGRRCEPWTTARGGSCTPCGARGQGACRITDKGAACQPGLKRALAGVCVVDQQEMLRQDALARMDEVASQILPVASRAIASSEDASYVSKIREEDPSFVESRPDNNACGGQTDTWSVSVDGDIALIVGVEGEVGAAISCADHRRGQKDSKWFAAHGFNVRAGLGAGVGLTLGFWRDQFDELRGKSHGFVFDVVQMIENATTGPFASMKRSVETLKSKKPGVSVAVGLWYEDYPKGHRCPAGEGDWCPKFQGWTLSVGGDAGWDLGGKYSKSTTVQFCTVEMKCAEGVWQGRDKRLTVSGQTREEISVRVGDRPAVRYHRAPLAGKTYESADGKVVKFRKNFTLLKFDDGRPIELTRTADLPSPAARSAPRPSLAAARPAASIHALGLWDFVASGRTVTDEFVEQTDRYIVLRRYGTTQNRRYEKVGENEYCNARGTTLRFESDTRAVWISPDKTTVYRMSRR